ncbi:MAG: PD40 domain-containing protein, partial [Armatimonadetes bacterium]|nr:PD40 domain-containing protein [Armatimonadota bacterium]
TAGSYADAGTDKRTARPAVVPDGPVWLDNERLAWLAQEPSKPPQIVVLSAADRELKAYPAPTAAYALTFAAAAALVVRDDAEKVAATRPNLGGATNPRLLALSPDGSWLIFAAKASGEHPHELWRARPDGSDSARLSVSETPCQAISFAPDGSRLAWFDGPRVMTAGLADTAGRELKSYELAAVLQPQAPCWSPDGRELAYGVGSSDAWRLWTCPLDQPDKAAERPRLNFIETLQYVGPGRLLQTQKERDKDHRLISLRCPEDKFNSRLLVDNARAAALSADGLRLAYRGAVAVQVLWLFQPLAERPTAALPAATLPERPAGPPAPVSPKPRVVAPKPPSVQT